MSTRAIKRTIGRAVEGTSLAMVRAGFVLAERVGPSLGARWAERLWFTVPRSPTPAAVPMTPGTSIEVEVDGTRVVGEVWGSGPNVYLLHGWGGRRTSLGAMATALVSAGFRVIAFDGPGHGESVPGPSGRRRATLIEIADAIKAAVAEGGPVHGVVAHSGGCMALALAMQDGLEVPRAAFVAPLADFAPYVPLFLSRLGIGQKTADLLIHRVEERVGVPISAFDMVAMAPEFSSTELLLIHDRDDAETSWEGSAAIAGAWPGARLVTTTGLGHNRILRHPEILTEITSFMNRMGQTNSEEAVAT